MFVLECVDYPGNYLRGTVEESLEEHHRHGDGETFHSKVFTKDINQANIYPNSGLAIERIIKYVYLATKENLPLYNGRISMKLRLVEVKYASKVPVRTL